MKKLFIAIAMVMMFLSCVNTKETNGDDIRQGDTLKLRHAKELSLVKHSGYTIATVRNPWDTTAVLAKYILASESVRQDSLPQGIIVRVPLKKSLVFSSVHIGLITEFGVDSAIAGVCDARYINLTKIKQRIYQNSISDCGNSMTPDIERIIRLSPDAILLSPYENSSTNAKIEALGIPIIQCADYMESTPLARAEWMKFFGILYGTEYIADSLFNATEKEYTALKNKSAEAKTKPKVIFDGLYGSQWFVPGKYSTAASYIRDAGGINPFDQYTVGGSVPLSAEQVLLLAKDADYWLVRYASPQPMKMKDFIAENRAYSQFDAVDKGNVFVCNTLSSPVYDETPFHPHLFLKDLISIIHPELEDTSDHKYFKRL